MAVVAMMLSSLGSMSAVALEEETGTVTHPDAEGIAGSIASMEGDVNGDGKFNMNDIEILQNWLLGKPNVELRNWRAADFCEDDALDVFDLCLMKRALCEEMLDNETDVSKVTFGYYDESYNKPLPSARIAMKCNSFCDNNEILKVDVAMADVALNPIGYDVAGDYEYEIYPSDGYIHRCTDENLIINGESGGYKKKYSKEDLELFDIDGDFADYDSYHHESTEIDFRRYSVGSSGCITFSFLQRSGDDPIHQSTDGMKQCLFYYVGEKGVAVSNVSVENASDNYQMLCNSTAENQSNIFSTNPIRLICTNEDNQEYVHGSVIRKEFELQSNLDEDDYDVSVTLCEGIDLVKAPTYTINENGLPSIVVEFKVCDLSEFANIRFRVSPSIENIRSSENQPYFEQNIYCYHDSEYDYVSTVCLDCLSCYSENLQNHLRALDCQGEYIEIDNQPVGYVKNSSSADNSSVTVAGYISWTDVNGGVHAAGDIKVELYKVNDSSSSLVATSYTSSAGGYSCSFPTDGSEQNVKIVVVSQGTNITVKNTSNKTYSYESSTFKVSSFAKVNYTASNSTNIGKSISIQQGLALANKYIYSLESTYLNNIDVVFPNSSGTYFTNSPKIYLEPEDEFDWDVSQHEYGHYVQYCYGISSSPGGTHYLNSNLADSRQNKSEGIRLAWGEGWATYFAINLQKEMNAESLNIPNVGDTYYTDLGTGINVDAEKLPSNYWLGEANEATIYATLFDLTDDYDSLEDDNIYCDSSQIWNIIKSNKCKTLSEFITAFYASNYENSTKYALGSTLSRYKIAAMPNYPTNIKGNTPTFSWVNQGGSTMFPNNKFRLVFLDMYFNPILTTSYTTASSQTLTASQWTKIKSSSSVVYYCVETNQTDNPVTGSYYSTIGILAHLND